MSGNKRKKRHKTIESRSFLWYYNIYVLLCLILLIFKIEIFQINLRGKKMKNEPMAHGFFGKNTETGAEAVISKNLEYVFCAEASVYERKFAHLRERADIIARLLKEKSGCADIMKAVATFNEATEIYEELKGERLDFSLYFDEVNRGDAPAISKYSKILNDIYICKSIASSEKEKYEKKDFASLICEKEEIEPAEIKPDQDKKVSFVRGNQSGRAFEYFAKFVPGVLAEYEEDFKSACEAVANGESTYAIVPIENSLDGRLNSFYRLIEKYTLFIVLTAEVPSDDYETSTKFALVYKNPDIIEAEGVEFFECKITFPHQSDIGNIILAADYFGAEVCKIHSLPISFGGRENSFDIIFAIDGANISGLFCYLFLEYPHFSTVGFYTSVEEYS